MKIIKIMFISLAVLVAVVLTAAIIFIKTVDINRFKPLIIDQAGKALNRKVDFQKISLGISLSHGVNLKLSGLVITDDPAFAKEPFAAIKEVSASIDIFRYIFKKEVNVPAILIDSPKIKIIRQKDGSLNVQTIVQPGALPQAVPAPLALPAMLINSLKVINGTIVYVDNSFEPPLSLNISDLGMDLKITEKKITMDSASCSIGGGRISAKGALDDYLGIQGYVLEADAGNIKIQELIDQGKFPVRGEGEISAKVTLKGKGFTPEALQSSLSGKADVSATGAKLKGINLLRAVLDKISVVPGLSEKVQANLPQRFKDKLTREDTVLSDMKLPVIIENSRLMIKDASLGADEFLFKADGSAGFDGNFSLEGSFLIPKELADSMVASVSQLQYLLNKEGQIYLPLKVSGKVTEPKISVDAKYIARKLIQNEAEKQLMNVLDKAMGKKEPDNTQEGAQPQDQAQKPSTEDTVRDLLRGILKKKK